MTSDHPTPTALTEATVAPSDQPECSIPPQVQTTVASSTLPEWPTFDDLRNGIIPEDCRPETPIMLAACSSSTSEKHKVLIFKIKKY